MVRHFGGPHKFSAKDHPIYKEGCVLPIVIFYLRRMGRCRDHQEGALHVIDECLIRPTDFEFQKFD